MNKEPVKVFLTLALMTTFIVFVGLIVTYKVMWLAYIIAAIIIVGAVFVSFLMVHDMLWGR